MFVTLKTLLRTLLLPPAGPLLLAFAGAWLLAPGRGARAALGFALLAAGLGSLCGCCRRLRSPTGSPTRPRSVSRSLDLTRLPEAQAIVILGGAGERHAAPEYGGEPAAGGDLLERLTYGAYVAHRTDLPVLVIGQFQRDAGHAHHARARLRRAGALGRERVARHLRECAAIAARILRAAGVHAHPAGHATPRTSGAPVREFESARPERRGRAPAASGHLAEPNPMRYLPNVSALQGSTAALYELLGDVARRALAALTPAAPYTRALKSGAGLDASR